MIVKEEVFEEEYSARPSDRQENFNETQRELLAADASITASPQKNESPEKEHDSSKEDEPDN